MRETVFFIAKFSGIMALGGFAFGALIGLIVSLVGLPQSPNYGWNAWWMVGTTTGLIAAFFTTVIFIIYELIERLT